MIVGFALFDCALPECCVFWWCGLIMIAHLLSCLFRLILVVVFLFCFVLFDTNSCCLCCVDAVDSLLCWVWILGLRFDFGELVVVFSLCFGFVCL